MAFYIVKVKGKDLFFNREDGEDSISKTPQLFSKWDAEIVIKWVKTLQHPDTDEKIVANQLQIHQVKLDII